MAISETDLDAAISAYQAGESAKAASARYGFSQYSLYRRLKARGLSARGGWGCENAGPKHYAWKGGKYADSSGYVECWVPASHPLRSMAKRNGTITEHRLVVAESLGRPLRTGETVHHKDGNKANNQLANLQLRVGAHGYGQCARCASCGSEDILFEDI
jgi:hypothetical protein